MVVLLTVLVGAHLVDDVVLLLARLRMELHDVGLDQVDLLLKALDFRLSNAHFVLGREQRLLQDLVLRFDLDPELGQLLILVHETML